MRQLCLQNNSPCPKEGPVVPTASVKDDTSELLKNIVGALTFGIGSEAI